MQKLAYVLLPGLLVLALCSCHRGRPANLVQDLATCDTEVLIRNWEITKPVRLMSYEAITLPEDINDRHLKDQADDITDETTFREMFNTTSDDTDKTHWSPFIRRPYVIKGSYMQLDTLYPSLEQAFCYAATTIKSDCEQDIALIAGANGGLQLWLNNRRVLSRFSKDNLGGYQYPMRVHLKKGENFVLAKLSIQDGGWKFLLKACSLHYANENSLGNDYASFCAHYLIPAHERLQIKVWSPLIPVNRHPRLVIRDLRGLVVLDTTLSANASLSLERFPNGPYAIQMTTDSATFRQYFFYGDARACLDTLRTNINSAAPDEQSRRNAALVADRLVYMDTVNVAHDNAFERKFAASLYELNRLHFAFQQRLPAVNPATGLHLYALNEDQYAADSYLLYVPENYRADRPLPLVVMVPHETGVRPFNVSTYVADVNRLEHICKLARRYGYAVLWSDFRVYNNHNLTRMIPQLLFKTVRAVRAAYAIDTTRLYAYGDCAGGELALFIANKYPSYFAAVGVEGPAIPDNPCSNPDIPCAYGSQNDIVRDFYNTSENYRNFPTLIIHSVNDEKCPFVKSKRLADQVTRLGGNMQLQELHVRKGKDLFFLNVMPDNHTMTTIFKFYQGKSLQQPDSVSLATWQLKYNRAFWLEITAKERDEKALVNAHIDRAANTIVVDGDHVNALRIDPSAGQRLNLKKNVRVIVNGRTLFDRAFPSSGIRLNLSPVKTTEILTKNAATEGPMNDFFAQPFLVVTGSGGTPAQQAIYAAALDTFRTNWKANFLTDSCLVKPDIAVTAADLQQYNLLLLGTAETNRLFARLQASLPLSIKAGQVVLNRKVYEGNDLSFLMLYPNPLNTRKYLLLAGGNAAVFNAGILNNIVQNGWFDYLITANHYNLDAGYFSKQWH